MTTSNGKPRSLPAAHKRAAARALSDLLVTPDGKLSAFRARHIGRESELDLDYLKQAREILEQLCMAIRGGNEDEWTTVRETWQAMTGVTGEGHDPGTNEDPSEPNARQSAPSPPSAPEGSVQFRVAEAAAVGQGPKPPKGPTTMPAPARSETTSPLPGGSAPLPGFVAAPQGSGRRPHANEPVGDFMGQMEQKADVQAPKPDQVATEAAPCNELKDMMRKAEEAIHWPVETYAYLCARLAIYPDQSDALWAEQGLGDPTARGIVERKWKSRLGSDPKLHQRYKELLKQYRSGSKR